MLVTNYPRGQRELAGTFSQFTTSDTVRWFENRGVHLKTESDGRMFPSSNNSETIIECLLREAEKCGVHFFLQHTLSNIFCINDKFHLKFNAATLEADKIIVAVGGYPQLSQYAWLQNLDIEIIRPVPSLFTFNIKNSVFKGLEGVVMEQASVKIQNSNFIMEGPVLITHWGLSGPAVLKLSAFAALWLADVNYTFNIILNVMAPNKQDVVRQMLLNLKLTESKKVANTKFANLSSSIWLRYCTMVNAEDKYWSDISNQTINKLAELLTGFVMAIDGKSVNKEEFVTAGGVNLKQINHKTNEHKSIKGLFFAGEVLNVDGITGGFNFQHAWSSGYIAGIHASMPENPL